MLRVLAPSLSYASIRANDLLPRLEKQMARTVFCSYLKKEAEGLDFQLYPGELGERIFNNISKQAWAEWQTKQTMLINEKRLNLMDPASRAFLEEQMQGFLFAGKDVEIEGYVPPEK